VEDDDFGDDDLAALNSNSKVNYVENEKFRSLFQIESKNLNADNEMIRMFGAKIVQGERAE
jgi:hypothetical protein